MASCPLCSAPLVPDPRHPRRVCPACAALATDSAGRPLRFYNEELTGGIIGRYADTDAAYAGRDCTVRGVRCRADEAHLGGIVIQIAGDG